MLVSLPQVIPLVILRGSGETTAALARLAAENGVRTLAHAEGGGVLYVHAEAARDKVLAIVAASVDRLGVCNRLNLCLVDRRCRRARPRSGRAARSSTASRCAATSRARDRSTSRSGTSGPTTRTRAR